MKKQFGFVLPSFGMQLAIGAAILAATNIFTAIKVADYVQDQNDLKNLTAQVAVVERERVVEILDKKTLEEALAKQAQTHKNALGVERVFNELLQKRLADPKPWCELDADELRIWNAENAGSLFDDDFRKTIEDRRKLPGETPPS